MAKFTVPTTESAELAGPLGQFKDQLVALQAVSKIITVQTKYGPSEAIRVQVVDPKTGDDQGIRLLFWPTMQAQVTAAHTGGDDWAVGYITEQPQKDRPDRSFYSLTETSPSDEDAVDYAAVGAALDSYERQVHAKSHPGAAGVHDETPF